MLSESVAKKHDYILETILKVTFYRAGDNLTRFAFETNLDTRFVVEELCVPGDGVVHL